MCGFHKGLSILHWTDKGCLTGVSICFTTFERSASQTLSHLFLCYKTLFSSKRSHSTLLKMVSLQFYQQNLTQLINKVQHSATRFNSTLINKVFTTLSSSIFLNFMHHGFTLLSSRFHSTLIKVVLHSHQQRFTLLSSRFYSTLLVISD